MKEYLDEIALFNQINEQNNQQNLVQIDKESNDKFLEYDYEKKIEKKQVKTLKPHLKKGKRLSQKKILA